MDYETQKLLNALEQEMFQKKQMILEGIYAEFFHEHFYEQDGAVHQYALLKPYLDKDNNIFAFETGFGEGFYAELYSLWCKWYPCKINYWIYQK